MKKLATLLLAAGLVFGVSTGANAIDFKVSGKWVVDFDYGQGGNYMKNTKNGKNGYNGSQDEFTAMQRFRVKLQAIASENLSGTLYFEIGQAEWGKSGQGAALGADEKVVKVKNAFIDWTVPETALKVRMGVQTVGLPSFAMKQSMAFSDDVAGVVASYKFNDNVAASLFWLRPYNDNFDGKTYTSATDSKTAHANYLDNIDMFGLTLPFSFDGFKITPYGMIAAIGPNALRLNSWDKKAGEAVNNNYFGNVSNLGATAKVVNSGLLPAWGFTGKDAQKLTAYGTGWWAGLTADVSAADPFHFALDFTAGGVQYDDSHYNRAGWFVTAVAEYKLDWGTPGIFAWYASGDDDNPKNGSERLPQIVNAQSNDYSSYAFFGPTEINREAVFAKNLAGLWGVGLRLKDMSFVENLKHTFHIMYMGGTNSYDLVKKIGRGVEAGKYDSVKASWGEAGVGTEPVYLTDKDSAWEFGLRNEYKMYENFKIVFDAAYIALNMDSGTKKNMKRMGYIPSGASLSDSWNVKLCFEYQF